MFSPPVFYTTCFKPILIVTLYFVCIIQHYFIPLSDHKIFHGYHLYLHSMLALTQNCWYSTEIVAQFLTCRRIMSGQAWSKAGHYWPNVTLRGLLSAIHQLPNDAQKSSSKWVFATLLWWRLLWFSAEMFNKWMQYALQKIKML